MISCFVLEQLTQAGSSLLGSPACFSILQQGSGVTRVCQTHPLTRPSQLWLGLAWLARRLHSGAAVSPHCAHTHTGTKHTLGNKTHTHTHTIPQSRGLCIPNYFSDMETLQSRKHLPFPPSLTCQH